MTPFVALNLLVTNLLVCFSLITNESANANGEKVYFGPFVDSVSKNIVELDLIRDEDIVKSLLGGIKNSKHIDKADFAVMSRGWLLAIQYSNGLKFYRVFERTTPRNTVFPCKFIERDNKYFLESFAEGFAGLKLEFDTKLLTDLKNQ